MIAFKCQSSFNKFTQYQFSQIIKRHLFANPTLRQSKIKQALWDNLIENKTYSNKKEFKVKFLNSEIICNTDGAHTPYSIIFDQNKEMLANGIIAKVNGVSWDLNRVLNEDCTIELVGFEDPSGQSAFWRSSAFVLNAIIEKCFGGEICCADTNESGFFCDSFLHNKNITVSDLVFLENKFNEIVHSKACFERIDICLQTVKKLFSNCPYKMSYLMKLENDNKPISLYRISEFIDICEGPLVMHTGQLKYMKLTANGSIKSEFDDKNNSLQRVYGVSFPREKLFKEWTLRQEEAKNRDHRLIGQAQKLFFFHPSSPGSAFFLPLGTHICNKLVDFIKEQYKKRGFSEVNTPQIFDCSLWKTSGHWDLYQDNLFKIPSSSDQVMSLKPMNCPAHCLIYAHEARSHKDLPLRFADFGALHRNESTSTLTGLTRLRKFHQDDAHIFCRPDQIEQEINASLEFLECVYKVLNFQFHLSLSTRPVQFLGDVDVWDFAEQQLTNCLDKFSDKWSLNSGDGAFYGPKIDISITDAMNRHHQCATIQLDFQLPLRFDLKYSIDQSAGQYERPVIIHRAILGSIERLLAILIESNSGKWPFWLNPRQILIVPVSRGFTDYSVNVWERIKSEGFMCDIDLADDTSLNKKILLGQKKQYNCILVIGQKEIDNEQVALRTRDGKNRGSWKITDLLSLFRSWDSKRINRIEDCFNL